jgi:hypothetical protein
MAIRLDTDPPGGFEAVVFSPDDAEIGSSRVDKPLM